MGPPRLENALTAEGLRNFVPLPAWSPDQRIPDAFADARRADGMKERVPNLNPNRKLPDGLRPPKLFTYESATALAEAVDSYHGQTPRDVGGLMADIHTSAGALIFYPWHAFVDELYWRWQLGGTVTPPTPGLRCAGAQAARTVQTDGTALPTW